MRDQVVSVRLSAAEHKELTERATGSGKSLSDFVRGLLVAGRLSELAALPPIGHGSITTTTPKCTIIWNSDITQDGGNLNLRNATP